MSSHPNFTDHLQNSDEEANLGFQKYERGYLSTPRNTRFEYDKSSAVVDDDEEEEEDQSLLSPKHEKSFGTLKRGITTLARKAKTITLASNATFKNGEEFETLRYTACTTDPDRFVEKNYSLRVSNLKRNIEIFVVVTMYNEDENAFNRTLFALAQNIQYLCEKNKYGWDENSWQKVAICIVGDGRSKIHENVLKVLSVLGVYQDGIAQSAINKKETVSHIFEYTAQKIMDESRQIWSSKHKIPPLQLIFCLKEKNAKKINSHRYVGTKPERSALYYLWKAFFINPQIAGACGEIRADLGRGMTRIKNFCNPLTASQNFEYKISNLVDKALESVFGYISVPGAF
ncbi:Chitin synthase, class 2, partial [Lobulomyces angularis]